MFGYTRRNKNCLFSYIKLISDLIIALILILFLIIINADLFIFVFFIFIFFFIIYSFKKKVLYIQNFYVLTPNYPD